MDRANTNARPAAVCVPDTTSCFRCCPHKCNCRHPHVAPMFRPRSCLTAWHVCTCVESKQPAVQLLPCPEITFLRAPVPWCRVITGMASPFADLETTTPLSRPWQEVLEQLR